jgi:serine/threonine-protein kinase
MIGETISHYHIVDRIGAGGMGEVYRAQDPRLDREVAIKVLSTSITHDPTSLGRFEGEARAAAALDHPNILAIHDVGRHDGVPYIVSELLEGSSLRDRLDAGDVTRRTAVQYAVQVAEGLSAAHSRGIIHRDVKPANLFVTRDGHIKILDFGLAKLTQDERVTRDTLTDATPPIKTEAGTVVGTIGYMSPEQLNGTEVDHRSDIFSFGIVLYEMLAGERPFGGTSGAKVAAAILRDDPPPLDAVKPPVSQPLERIVRRCLEKRPEDRFESAHDLAIALQAVEESSGPTPYPPLRRPRRIGWRVAAATTVLLIAVAAAFGVWRLLQPAPLPEYKRLAVLPFEAVDDDTDVAILADGLAEAVTDGLALFEEDSRGRFWVVTRRATASQGGTDRNQLHRWFNVNLVIEGQLRLAEDRLRLKMTVVDAETGRALRSDTIEDHVSNISCLQRDPVLMIAEMLGFTIDRSMTERVNQMATNVPVACVSYLKGRGLLAETTDAVKLERSVEFLRKAVESDPLYAPARVALARGCRLTYEVENEPAWIAEGVEHAMRAIDLMEPPAEAYIALAQLYRTAGDTGEALEALEQAVGSAPTHVEAHLELATAYQQQGRLDEAEAAFQRAINLRPSYWASHNSLGSFLIAQGRYDAAANQFRRVCELVPDSPVGFNNLGGLYWYLERRNEAREMFERSIEIEPNADVFSNLGTLDFESSRFGDAVANFERAVEMSPDDFQLWGNLAAAHQLARQWIEAERAFLRAIELGEAAVAANPDDDFMTVDLASYNGVVGNQERGSELLQKVVSKDPQDPYLMGSIAEAFKDLGKRGQAIEWIESALANGLSPEWIERRPGLRDVSADPRIQALLRKDHDSY